MTPEEHHKHAVDGTLSSGYYNFVLVTYMMQIMTFNFTTCTDFIIRLYSARS